MANQNAKLCLHFISSLPFSKSKNNLKKKCALYDKETFQISITNSADKNRTT